MSIAILIVVIIPEQNVHIFFIKSPISVCFQKWVIISFYFGLLELYSEIVDLHLILLKVNGKIAI